MQKEKLLLRKSVYRSTTCSAVLAIFSVVIHSCSCCRRISIFFSRSKICNKFGDFCPVTFFLNVLDSEVLACICVKPVTDKKYAIH